MIAKINDNNIILLVFNKSIIRSTKDQGLSDLHA